MTTNGLRVEYLEHLIRTRGMYIAFYDPDGKKNGIPTYPWKSAPTEYATARQLRAAGLRPGGQQVQAQVLWRHGKQIRKAYLYNIGAAKLKRTATPAQRVAIEKALRARRTCSTCGQEKDYYIRLKLAECQDCHDTARYGAAA